MHETGTLAAVRQSVRRTRHNQSPGLVPAFGFAYTLRYRPSHRPCTAAAAFGEERVLGVTVGEIEKDRIDPATRQAGVAPRPQAVLIRSGAAIYLIVVEEEQRIHAVEETGECRDRAVPYAGEEVGAVISVRGQQNRRPFRRDWFHSTSSR